MNIEKVVRRVGCSGDFIPRLTTQDEFRIQPAFVYDDLTTGMQASISHVHPSKGSRRKRVNRADDTITNFVIVFNWMRHYVRRSPVDKHLSFSVHERIRRNVVSGVLIDRQEVAGEECVAEM